MRYEKMKSKKTKKDPAVKDQQDKKQSKYPKAMTIRYTQEQEVKINEMVEKMGQKTMSKAFLAAPDFLSEACHKIHRMESDLMSKENELIELRAVVDGWKQFNEKLAAFVEKK